MSLIIDCYNLLHTTMPAAFAGMDEAKLCHALSRSRWGDGAVIVCDGDPKPGLLAESPVAGIDMVYSGKSRSADDVIEELVDQHSSPRKLIVVSNDRQVQKAARRRRAQAWSCEQFIRALLNDVRDAPGPAESELKRTQSLSDGEVQRWLKTFGVEPEDHRDEDDEPPWWKGLPPE